jgi:hypothetical protein
LSRTTFAPDAGEGSWVPVREFLGELKAIGAVFGLVSAARHPRSGEWLDLEGLLEQTRTEIGRKWLEKCALRIYTPEDYLVRWRRIIAERMGFSSIPDCDLEASADTDPSASRIQFSTYLTRAGVSRDEAARGLGVSKSLLSQYMTARKRWTRKWRERVSAWIANRTAPG